MNSHSTGRISARLYFVCLVVATMLLFAFSAPAFGQKRSSDRDNPTLLKSKVISDRLDGSDDEYFYRFSAGPGKLTVTFDVKANGTNAGAYLDLFDGNSNPILENVLAQGVDSGSERIVKSVQLNKRRNIIMRIKGIRYGDSGGTGIYKIRLDGAVRFQQATTPDEDAALPPARSNRRTAELNRTDSRSLSTGMQSQVKR